MKRIALFMSIAMLAFGMLSCGGSTEKKNSISENVDIEVTAKVMVYYFHGKKRCKTCITIQEVAAKTIMENFADNTDVKFLEIDFSEKANEELAEKYEVASSSLIIVSVNEHIDLTSTAFANAVRNPEILNETIVSEINNFLNK
jgi:thiol-disulfide isomerase/thioredoxin